MSASVAIDDSIRRLRSSGRSIREIKRLPRHESPKLSRLPKVYPCAVVAGPRNWRRRCWRWWSTRPSPNPDCPMSNWRPASQRGSASVSVLPWLRTRREAPLSLLEWDREHGQEAWDARITGNRPFSITKLDLLRTYFWHSNRCQNPLNFRGSKTRIASYLHINLPLSTVPQICLPSYRVDPLSNMS